MWILFVNFIVASAKKECQAERLLERIQTKYDESRDGGATCSQINYQQHNLCSLLLATTFTQRYAQL